MTVRYTKASRVDGKRSSSLLIRRFRPSQALYAAGPAPSPTSGVTDLASSSSRDTQGETRMVPTISGRRREV